MCGKSIIFENETSMLSLAEEGLQYRHIATSVKIGSVPGGFNSFKPDKPSLRAFGTLALY
jgi:hypothetical protein